MAGDTLIIPQVTVRLLRHLTATASAPRPIQAHLTPREKDVVRLIATGKTNNQIAEELFLSTGTVKNHVSSIQRKLGVPNRVGIAAWAWETRQVNG